MDSLGPLIGPVAPAAETTPDGVSAYAPRAFPPRRGNRHDRGRDSFLRGGCTKRPGVCIRS